MKIRVVGGSELAKVRGFNVFVLLGDWWNEEYRYAATRCLSAAFQALFPKKSSKRVYVVVHWVFHYFFAEKHAKSINFPAISSTKYLLAPKTLFLT